MTPLTPASLAQRLRAIAQQLDAGESRTSQTMLQALVAPHGLLQLTSEAAGSVRRDLDAWDQALAPDPASNHLCGLSLQVAEAEAAIVDALHEAALHLPATARLMADHASPAEAAAAALAAEQDLWDGPEVRDNERVHLWWPDGSEHVPVPGLAAPRRGYVYPWGAPLFTRRAAELIVADMLADDAGFEAAFQPDGSLVYTWPREYDGESGRMHVIPDDRGLYAIGGQWPWEYSRPGNADLTSRAQAARITASSTPTTAAQTEAAVHHTAPAPGPGRTR